MKLHCIKELAAPLLLLCSWATVSAVELNVQPNHTDENNLRGTNRQLNHDVVFKRYENTECLMQNHKEGDKGTDYDETTFIRSRQECENTCLNHNECIGFDYKIGSAKVCRVWKTPSGIKPFRTGFDMKSDCYIKEDNTMIEQSGTQECQKKCLKLKSCKNKPSFKNDNFKVYKKTECLKQNRKEGGQGRNYYEVNDGGSRKCRKECRDKWECTGFEYSKIGYSTNICRLWKTPIGIEPYQIGSSKKSECYIKEYNAMTEQKCQKTCLQNCKRNNMFK